ncbi:MAG TPA: Asp-tRNA(Asn)/Glu-tRNA(Gln) amidotransferase subunit GatC [Candidatus Ratteibacteria bacterium]|uniref:Aspartyl/glutamyl-tRNA(Asn/Gln) amidotransferase subunit C n=1 Tax=candidate division TA06 bacterium ADurb.Bin131 TaxID=1852827 RepID=A0A1V6CDY3_UNCT6|nr:MAG: Aspartyl/glutamyl-tRNA(Asn/Gln) amidotransferase subunit C [candidate division TA06 bacterium ADurb.Bin131]HPC29919.1 Asp-tRNA(Asn)/Glu-tRNA(Gln) amidotransferase subunit GatC [bacterium]HQL65252.1 Asp-tRNA(Asn)/Glu-tRNA(Gln) amidotransferase subunit GatC [bacterium]HRS05611.1 Asp-tRNA(Asn)/Glu-tRNA(Gln) amidotransferase subunit GatC [Candidatus Ratteibacteria bacterium]HRV03734.1 Asp-tRNA(Asn)/Glu-tRNA(Gln) amidotransferase subunit GatC [Candidatus Ratteibacteria bacterium]
MEKIDRKTVNYLAKLARIRIDETQMDSIVSDLATIISYVSQLNQINTEDVQPAKHVLPFHNISRKDNTKPSLPLEDVLKNAPEKTGNFFKVPKII